ncbi:MAG: hypothetical protein HY980_02580, partial [Candidatus Magasanikbacteria bacterium]|nr:hypothetical protein [Candidatus Magasanikbacteria bacterium]
MQSLFKRKFFLILKRFFGLFEFKKSRASSGVLIVVLVIGATMLLIPSVAGAEVNTGVLGGGSAPGMMENVANGIADILTNVMLGLGEFCIKMSIFFLRFFIALASYNGYIDSPVVKLGWLMVRDVVNMFFVVILLVIAIGTILGMEQYQWNKTLIKLILAAVFVNFSNLICQIFIDAAHVFTMTFASAIAATAGGNLIKMFHFENIYAIVTGSNDIGMGGEGFNMTARVLVGAIVAFLFALLAMLIMGAYTIMMLLRMVVLWVLIILSPIAFLFIALPQTQNRYGEWWKEFSNYVVLAPTIAFFMWLAFATAGTGTLGSDIGITDNMDKEMDAVGALTVSAVTTWANMANFLVALVLLFVGLQEVQKLNVAGGSVASKAKDFFGKVATIATGYAAGRWLAGGAAKLGKMGVMGGLKHVPVVGGQAWAERGKLWGARIKDAWYKGAAGKGELHEEDTWGRGMRGLFGWNLGRVAAHTARRRKRLRAAEKTAEDSAAALEKQQSAGQWGNRARTRRGELEAYDERSKARDAEGVQAAKLKVLQGPRWKDGDAYVNPETGEVSTLADEAARFTLRKEMLDNEQKGLMGEKRKGIIDRSEGDRKRAAEESEKAREGRKSSELVAAEQAENSAKDTLQKAEAKIKVEVEEKLKIDTATVKVKTDLAEAEKEVERADKSLDALKKSDDYAALVDDKEDKKKAEEALRKINEQLEDKKGILTPGDRTKLGERKIAEEKKMVDAQARIDKNTKGLEEETKVKSQEERRQDAINTVEDAKRAIEKKKAEIAEELEKKTEVTAGGPTVEGQRKIYQDAQAKTNKARNAWGELAEAAAKPESATDTQEIKDQRKRDEVTKEKLTNIELGLLGKKEIKLPDGTTKIVDDPEKGTLMGADGKPVIGKDGKPVKRADSNIAVAYLQAKQRAATAGAGVEAAETEAQRTMLGLESFHSLFSAEVASKMGAEASKMFIDGIKEKKMGELFKNGAKELEKALKEGLEKGGASLEKLSLENVGARMAQAQMISQYNKDITVANKAEAADHAESIFTMERYGFKTPSSAFKDWVKKQTERLQGVEREQSVKNAMGTLGKFFKLQRQGKEISTDQKAQMMAHLKHLTSHGWMDDLLDGIGKKSRNKASFTGEEREEAEALEEVFLTKLRWDKNDNRSGADRTAQVQKLVGMGGDDGQMQAEEGVLWRMEHTGEGYSEANKRLAGKVYSNHANIIGVGADDDTRRRAAVDAGIITQEQVDSAKTDERARAAVEAGVNQLVAYTKKFVAPSGKLAESAEKAAEAFMQSMDRFQDAFEMLADFKNLAMETGHIDDGGHTYYDINEGKVRGNLGHKGKEFVLGEWRKLGLDQRLSRLKTHSTGQMSEDYGTIDYTASEECDDAIRETFAGLSNQREFAKVDGRNKDHMAGMAAGEAIRQDASGRTLIGDNDSRYFRGTFKHIEDKNERKKAVEDRLRGNYAAFLR